MPQNAFELECDRLSLAVDEGLFNQLRWARTEGPMLARLAELAHSALEGRSEFVLTEEGATREAKRFVLKVHNNRLVAITLWVEAGRANLAAELIDRSQYTLTQSSPISTDYEAVDEQWMSNALLELFSRIRS